MTFDEVLDQVRELLRTRGRVSYQSLKVRFTIADQFLEGVKAELIKAERVAVDEDNEVLVWVGASPVPSSKFQVPSQNPELRTPNSELSPVSYTPAHLAERIRAASLSDGERKTITALFADLKGSTALIEGLDPEEARAIIDPALQLMMDAVHRYEGYVAQALGDGIFALFGAPIAHEDHPQRALYAALRMQETMRHYSDEVRLKHGVPLAMRVGINTGEVIVRSIRKDDLHTDYVPIGHSTNLAARMEQMATPGSILITEYTRRLTEGYFEFRNLGKMQIKGVEVPLTVYEVIGAGPLRTRLQVSARRGLTRFVGRQSEMEQIKRALDQARTGHGQIVGVMGEPGLGKSRLFHEFKFTSQSGCLILEAYSVSHGKASPYLPVIELLKSYFDIQAGDDERKRQEKVGGKVLMLDRSLEDTLPYLFALLGIEEQPSPLQQMDPQIRRRRTFEALKKLFLRESLNHPLILIFEDLHWIDSETQGFLDTLSEGVASAKILLLVNYRPEYRQEWGQKTYYMQLRLAPFGKAEAEEFLDVLLGTTVGAPQAAPLQALKQLILEKTEGTPFFMEEIVQELVEQGVLVRDAVGARHAVPLPTDLHIPTTVQGVLAARIDRLTLEEKTLLQQLAVIGREFPVSLLRQVITQPEEERYRLLSSLQHKEFLYEQPAFPEVEYLFKHALTQEVAYNSVLVERRKALHEQTARAIEQLFHDRLEEHHSELAHHYQRSGNTTKAVYYLHLAAQQAVQRPAYTEAIHYLTTALNLLKSLPDTPERQQQELLILITFGAPLAATKGFGSPEAGKIYDRAVILCEQLGDTPQISPVLMGLWLLAVIRAELPLARRLGARLLSVAQSKGDPALLLQAHLAVGMTLYYQGEFVAALEHLGQEATLYDRQQHRFQVLAYGLDLGTSCQRWAALTLWALGYPDQARKKSQEAITLAQDLQHSFSLAFSRFWAGLLHQFCREPQAAYEQAEATLALANEYGYVQLLPIATLLRAWGLVTQKKTREGIEEMHQSGSKYRQTISGLARPQYLGWLADAYRQTDQPEAGLSTVEEAITGARNTQQAFYDAELYRLKGELTLQKLSVISSQLSVTDPRPLTSDPQDEAEACFLKAIKIARQQQAKSFELRATVSLARLWQQQGKTAEAHKMLAEIYNWFTEGFDTKDLREAKALIEELSH